MKGKEKDIYGQEHPEETPELVRDKLAEFDRQVDRASDGEKANARAAEMKCPELVTDGFKLMFLRCEVFNVDLAVARYLQYWDKRVEVFGPKKAFEPLTQDKALRDDGVALSTGFFRLTGTKGSGGRNIIFCDPSLQDKADYTTESMVRAVWYIFHAALENENTQKKGFLFVVYCWKSNMSHFDRELSKRIVSCVKGCLPLRLSGLHFVRPTKILTTIFPFVKVFLGERLRKRIKVHSENEEKAKAELEKYELYSDVIPEEVGGTLTLNHDRWLEERRLHGK